jgi:hypothetical protein
VAENRQFGGGRVFGDKAAGKVAGDGEHCAQCEAMLADALDGTLTAKDQTIFDLHAESCAACGQIIADARRGAAWLEMLRHPAPEPSADLLERILAQTSAVGLTPVAIQHETNMAVTPFGQSKAAMSTGYAVGQMPGSTASYANVIPFPRRAVAAIRRTAFGQVLLQPRLAMTAAMAFFSVALTMNITGFHPSSLQASDLTPSSLRRDVISANTQVVRYYESLRVVYELESRVHDLQSTQDTDLPAGSQTTPAQGGQPSAQPDGQTPAVQPDGPKAAPQPAGKRAAPNSGTSRRDDLIQTRHFVVSESIGAADAIDRKRARFERTLV